MSVELLHHGVGAVDVALMADRALVGTFFAISGAHKLFVPEYHKSVADLMRSLHIPFPRFNEWWVPLVEFSAGLGLLVGLLTPLAAAGLLTICIVACCTDGPRRVRDMEEGSDGMQDPSEVVDDVLYLPEAMYAVLLAILVLAGPGRYSLDNLVSGWY